MSFPTEIFKIHTNNYHPKFVSCEILRNFSLKSQIQIIQLCYVISDICIYNRDLKGRSLSNFMVHINDRYLKFATDKIPRSEFRARCELFS